MSELAEYVMKHTVRGACTCGRCMDAPEDPEDHQPNGHTVDLFFFQVALQGEPDPEELKQLILEHPGEFHTCDPLDGEEHSYMELGGWIGDQGLAMQFMGLGHLLGLWKVMQPKLLGALVPEGLQQQLAGQGMVTIMPMPQKTESHEVGDE